jgi:hypothetical protein
LALHLTKLVADSSLLFGIQNKFMLKPLGPPHGRHRQHLQAKCTELDRLLRDQL